MIDLNKPESPFRLRSNDAINVIHVFIINKYFYKSKITHQGTRKRKNKSKTYQVIQDNPSICSCSRYPFLKDLLFTGLLSKPSSASTSKV